MTDTIHTNNRKAEKMNETEKSETDGTCRHCGRAVVLVDGWWVDPEAMGDDSVWRESCDSHDTFTAEHEVAAS